MTNLLNIKFFSKCLLLIGLLFFINATSYAQEADTTSLSFKKQKKIAKKARKAFRNGRYILAKENYDKLTNSNTINPEYWYEAGLTYFESGIDIEGSLSKLNKAFELSGEWINPDLYLALGDMHHYNSNFEKAIEYYNLYRTSLLEVINNKKFEEFINRKIEIANNGINLSLQERSKIVTVNNLGEKINSQAGDYSPVLSNDEELLLFCSRRPPSNKKTDDGQYFEDIFYTTKVNKNWKEALIIDKSSGYVSQELNKGRRHEAPISLSPDGRSLFIYTENSVWKSRKDNNGQWSSPKRMNQNVNFGKNTPNVFITPDGKELFIVSTDAKGGLGGKDIFYSTLLEDGTWDEPKNLGPRINTLYNEDAPFITKDGNTLYFASEGHNSIGKFDIFKSVKDSLGEWDTPINVGAPINSAGNDIYYIENGSGSIAYFSSQRPGTNGFLDIYQADYSCINLPSTTINGYAIYADSHQPLNGVIKITNKNSGEEMGTFTINSKGKYTMVLPPNETYILEFVLAQTKYDQLRPHTEEFFIPKQCEAYNLYQEIAVNYLRNESGVTIAQKAHFKNAMFDIESEVKTNFKTDAVVNTPFADSLSSITGELAYNSILKANNITVTLLNASNEILRLTKTDDNGSFTFEHIDISQSYKILINEDEAKRNYYGDNSVNNESIITIKGNIKSIKNTEISSITNLPVLFTNSDYIISNTKKTNSDGIFKMTNAPYNIVEIAELNGNTIISYNLNIPTKEVLFSAYLTSIDPNNTELTYGEYIDIIELKDVDVKKMPEFVNIYFDFDKYFLRNKGKSILDNLYDYLNDNQTATIRLDGHTDYIGTEKYNDKLSEERTLKAYKYLIDKGIAPERLVNEWFGETKPSVANTNADGSDNKENRQLNRRVEIKVEIPEMASLYIQL